MVRVAPLTIAPQPAAYLTNRPDCRHDECEHEEELNAADQEIRPAVISAESAGAAICGANG